MKNLIFKTANNSAQEKNGFKPLTKEEIRIYSDLISKIKRQAKKSSKSRKRAENKSETQFRTEVIRLVNLKKSLIELFRFETKKFTDDHAKKYNEENPINLPAAEWCFLVDYPFGDYQSFFCLELFWIWEDYSEVFDQLSSFVCEGIEELFIEKYPHLFGSLE